MRCTRCGTMFVEENAICPTCQKFPIYQFWKRAEEIQFWERQDTGKFDYVFKMWIRANTAYDEYVRSVT